MERWSGCSTFTENEKSELKVTFSVILGLFTETVGHHAAARRHQSPEEGAGSRQHNSGRVRFPAQPSDMSSVPGTRSKKKSPSAFL